jgi:hypothetical protein
MPLLIAATRLSTQATPVTSYDPSVIKPKPDEDSH